MATPSVDARSLYFPNDGIISADDPRVTHSSYLDLGLRCTVCGEPVQYRNGHVNVAHFAHFPSLDPQKREICDRRRESISGYGSTWKRMSRGQRLRLFQERFFNVVRNSLQGLETYNQIQKDEDTEKFYPICIRVLDFLRSRKGYFVKYIRTCDHYRVGLFEVDIACEAFDYLMVKSSERMALSILRYLIFKKSKQSSDDNAFSEEIGLDLSNVLLTLNWPQVVDRNKYLRAITTETKAAKSTKKINSTKKLESKKPYSSIELFQKVESGYNLFVYLRGNHVYLGSAKDDDLIDESLLGSLNAKGIEKQESMDNSSNKQLFSGDLEVLIIQKSNLFHLYEELIESKFLLVLRKTIQPRYKGSRRAIVQIEAHGEKIGLNMTVQKFLEIKSATIMSEKGSIAEIAIENNIVKNRVLFLFEKFFTASEEYLEIVKDEPMISDAILMLVRKTQRIFRKKLII